MRLAISAVLGVLAAMPALAQDHSVGRDNYIEYCASCHGSNGKGGGPLAELITVAPPDLTTLSQRNEGAFPMLQVIHIIDGRTGVRAHGGPMPVYGAVFDAQAAAGSGSYGSVLETRGRVLAVADFLESIQE
ncbi:cytochrome c [Halovulum dunhuangense]|uniref:Cytochrome c n=1 Tax=Halovulum dunhuangense TaxID=1505036 RepID=A0A849L2X8_9RHOB|nr:c-type cytochrome [Halovulum dunhuangense]NNU80686.1 cytochrome c [Halovulum dunhuangense]